MPIRLLICVLVCLLVVVMLRLCVLVIVFARVCELVHATSIFQSGNYPYLDYNQTRNSYVAHLCARAIADAKSNMSLNV